MPSGSRERHGRSRYRRRSTRSTAAALRRRRGAGAAWVGEAMRPQFKARRLSTLPVRAGTRAGWRSTAGVLDRSYNSVTRRRTTTKTAGYSGSPLHRKLGIKAGQRIWYSGAPDGYERELSKVGRLEVVRRLGAGQGFLHFFARRHAVLNREIQKLRESMAP